MSDIERYIDEICARLTADPLITSYQVLRRRSAAFEGYYRIAAVLTNGDILELAAYLQFQRAIVETVDYRFQWMSPGRTLRVRWDNTPHHRQLPGFPHHKHDGREDRVVPNCPIDASRVLDEIAARLC